MNIPKISALYESSLASALSSTGTSFTLVSATDRDGNALSGRYGFIIEEGSADEEFVIGTVSGTAVTIEYRGIDADAPNTEVSANKKGHRRGASVKITDYPILGVVRNILNGDESLPNPLKYASGVTPVSADDLVDKAYADALVGGGSLSYDRIVISGNAGETVSAGQILYLNTADGEWYKADADTAAQVENVNLGIAQGAGTDGNGITGGVLTYGLDTSQTGLSLNTKYYASNTAGGLSSTPGTKEVTLGVSRSATSIFFSPRYDQQITEDIQDALTPGGVYGTPSSSNPFLTKDYNASATGLPVVKVYTANTPIGSSTTQFDITNISATTYRYTYDGTGTNPSISAASFPVGTVVDIQAQNFSAGNNGLFVVTSSGSNYFEVTNASGVVESDKTIGTGYINKGAVYTKPASLKYIKIEIVGAGGGSAYVSGGSGNQDGSPGGGAGGYSSKLIPAASLGSTENYIVGYGGSGGTSGSNNGTGGGRSVFGSLITCNGGSGGTTSDSGAGAGGSATGGDVNITGAAGQNVYSGTTSSAKTENTAGLGGITKFGQAGYGCGADGAYSDSTTVNGAAGKNGVIILTEYFS